MLLGATSLSAAFSVIFWLMDDVPLEELSCLLCRSAIDVERIEALFRQAESSSCGVLESMAGGNTQASFQQKIAAGFAVTLYLWTPICWTLTIYLALKSWWLALPILG